MSPSWKPFYFEGNQYSGMIDSPQAWGEVVKAYTAIGRNIAELLSRVKSLPDGEAKYGHPRFGLYREYTASPTLKEWAQMHQIQLGA